LATTLREAIMQSDDTVRRALKALAEADASRHASPHVEGALLDAFERDKVRGSSRWSAWPALAVAIVIVALAIVGYREALEPRDVTSGRPSATLSRSEQPPTASENQIGGRVGTETARPSAASTRSNTTAVPSARSRLVTYTPYGSEMVGQIVQLRLPRSTALQLLGVPIVESEIQGTVNVELLLTEDGQTRPIRIVQ
jgi:hypothetical protein